MCIQSQSFADGRIFDQNALYLDIGLFYYQDSPYFNRAESLGLFNNDKVTPGTVDGGLFFTVWDNLSIGGSFMYAQGNADFQDGDYGGKITLTNVILSVPVRYHIRKSIFMFSFGASAELPLLRKDYSLSTNVNKDNNGNPSLSGSTFGHSFGLGLLTSFDVRVNRRNTFFLEYWYHFALPIHNMNAYGDDLVSGGGTLAIGMRLWV